MIKAIIFDLDNTLLDFVKMKQFAVKAAITAMIEAGLNVDEEKAYKDIFDLYVSKGWENQQVFDDYLNQTVGNVCILYTYPSPRDRSRARMPASA